MEGQDEQWLGLVEFPGYEVSDRGRVRSLRKPGRPSLRSGTKRPYRESPKYLSEHAPKSRNTYKSALLRNRRDTVARAYVHYLVLTAFAGPRPEGLVSRHFDGNKHNNRASNLSWGTQSENLMDRVRHGTNVMPKGEQHSRAKLTDDAVREIRAEVRKGQPPAALAGRHGVTERTVYRVASGRSWSHVI